MRIKFETHIHSHTHTHTCTLHKNCLCKTLSHYFTYVYFLNAVKRLVECGCGWNVVDNFFLIHTYLRYLLSYAGFLYLLNHQFYRSIPHYYTHKSDILKYLRIYIVFFIDMFSWSTVKNINIYHEEYQLHTMTQYRSACTSTGYKLSCHEWICYFWRWLMILW